jgi:hypothetical protein
MQTVTKKYRDLANVPGNAWLLATCEGEQLLHMIDMLQDPPPAVINAAGEFLVLPQPHKPNSAINARAQFERGQDDIRCVVL